MDAAALLGTSEHERLERFISTLDAIDQGLQVIGPDWRYLYLNAAAARQGRAEREALLGRSMLEAYPGIDQTDLFRRLSEAMVTRRPQLFENQFQYPDGKTGWFEIRVEPWEEGIIVFSVDITRRKLAETQFLHAQKLDVVGRLAGGVAHDFNNLLSVILVGVRMVLDDLEPQSRHREELEDVYQAGERAAALTRQLLAFSRNQATPLRYVDLSAAVTRCERMLRATLGEQVTLTIDVPSQPVVVRAERNLLEQVLLNLVINARDAMPRGGTVTLSVRADGANAGLTVTDTGQGMDEATRARIFEPFFTTKPRGKGTGLGLSTVFDVVQRLGGSIEVQSAPDEGACFTVSLPMAPEGTGPEVTPPRRGSTRVRATSSVLVVDDERAVLNAAAAVLRNAGYEVTTAGSADEALALAQSLPRLALLVTDVVMPGKGGGELARALRQARPGLPVLFMSGYAAERGLQELLEGPDVALLDKPLSPEQLLAQVDRLLAR